MQTIKQPDNLTQHWLYTHGYTVRQAARAINRSHTHVAFVLSGKRKSPAVQDALRKLPRRPLVLRAR